MAHQHSPGAKGGRRKSKPSGEADGGLSTKIHATVAALGNPTGFRLTPGLAYDLERTDVLLKGAAAGAVLADKPYDAQARVIEPLLKAGKIVVIPPRATRVDPRDYDKHMHQAQAVPLHRHSL
ncbi:MAG: transposase [Giesbergeria sp.]|nr:transposase [Giesbergeria sp.]MBP9895733.1 transposase [Giesbergeria sp.]